MARKAHLRLSIHVINIERFGVRAQGVGHGLGLDALQPFLMIAPDLLDALRPFQFNERLPLAPRKRRTVLDRILLVCLGLLECLRMFFAQPHPFDLLLKEAEGAAASRAPGIVFREPETGSFENIKDTGLVDARILKRQFDNKFIVLGGVAVPVLLIAPDGHVAKDLRPVRKQGTKPLLERPKLELPRAPPRLRRRQEVVVLSQPEIKVPVGIEVGDRLTEKPFKSAEILVDLR